MPTTPVYGLHYPTSAYAANVPADVQLLANDTETALAGRDTAINVVQANLNALGTWVDYTPTWTGTTNPALGNGTLKAGYVKIGKMCTVRMNLVMGSTTTYGTGGWAWTLPFTARTISGASTLPQWSGAGLLLDSTFAYYLSTVGVVSAGTVFNMFANGNGNFVGMTNQPFTWSTNDSISASVTYETV